MNKTTMVFLAIGAVIVYFWMKKKTATVTAPVVTAVSSEEAQVTALLQSDVAIG
jgi:hypothetical protein